jgi:mono/diheme cytochrome c family protein
MKKILIAAGFLTLGIGFSSCGASGDDPGRAYMPDMYYSRAYETYGYNDVGGEYDSLTSRGIRYSAMPVPGTVARGEALSYHLSNDSAGLVSANSLKNPLDTAALTTGLMKEAERLYLVNCGICHGTALDGNGPLYNDGNGPYPAAPKNLTAADSKAFSDGHFFHVITFGKGSMGSYASQLTPAQRWWVIKYIRKKQGGGAATDSTAKAGPAMATTALAGGAAKTMDSTNKK